VLKPNAVVELGVHNGVSYFSFCQAVKRLNMNTACYAVDTWKGDEHSGFYEEEVFEKVADYNAKTFSRFSTLIRSTFDEAKEYFIDGTIDLLHIDGLHTYEAVKHDFEGWLPKLSENSIVIFHDINVRDRNFGVFKVWDELRQNYPHFQFDFGYGLGILAIGKILQPELKELFNENRNEAYYSFIRNIFSERGLFFRTNFYRDLELQEKGNKLRVATERIAEMEAHILDLGAWGRRFDKEIEEKNGLINNKAKELDEITAEKEKQTVLIESFAQNFQQLADLNVERNQWLKKEEQLKQELQTATEKKSKIEAELQERDDLINEQSQIVERLELEKRDKTTVIAEQKDQVKNLSLELESRNRRLTEIYESEGWKALKRYYNIKGKLLPENSKRYNILKKIVNKLRGKKIVNEGHVLTPANTMRENSHPEKSQGYHLVETYEIIEFPLFEHPKVSVVIPAYNGWHINYNCLRSIKQHTYGVSYEVIFADDQSVDETKNIKDYIKNITVIRNETNLGFLKNCNHAASFAKGDYIHFLNNDTEVTAGWLNSLTELLDRDAQIGMAGSKLVYPDGRLQEAGGIIWQDASGWNYGHNQECEGPEFNYLKEVDYISGASIMVRKTVWQKLGGFDERYSPAYCEDSDLAFAIRKMNMKVVYQPLSVVIHHEGFSHGSENDKDAGLNIKSFQKINTEKFAKKWHSVLNKHFANGTNVFWARDRSQNKKTILVIDHYVPHFDKDAGSKTVFQYLKLFSSLNLNVKFIGDNFCRHEPYTTMIQQAGIEVLYGSYYANNWQQWIKNNHDKFSFVLLNRPHIGIKYIDLIREKTKAKILYYGHDLHFIREQKQFEIEKKSNLLGSVK